MDSQKIIEEKFLMIVEKFKRNVEKFRQEQRERKEGNLGKTLSNLWQGLQISIHCSSGYTWN